MSELQEMVAQALGRDSAIELIEYKKQWITIGEAYRLAERVNGLIDATGANPRDPVAIVPRNGPGLLIALLGLIGRERHIRMIHPYQSPAGIARDVARLKPAVLVATAADFSEEVVALLVARGMAGVALDRIEAMMVAGCERALAECDPPVTEPQVDLLTSGTTGPPKQFPLTYELMARSFSAMMPPVAGVEPLSLPPAHLYWPFGNFSGLCTLMPLLQGRRAVVADRFTLAECHDYLLRFRPQMFNLPPAGVQMIVDADIPAEDLASVTFVSTGSAPLALAAQCAFEDKYGIAILQAYGATEFCGPVAMMTPDLYPEWGKKKRGSVGRPCHDAQIRVIDPNNGQLLPHGSEGLLEVIAPRIGTHWIRTSDLGVIDEDGFVWHRGRADGAIVRGGFKLLPETIEQALALHECVAAAMATGIPDRRLGQVPAVGIKLKRGARKPSVEELEKHLREHVEATHIPVEWRFMESLPYNAMMKADRLALREAFETARRSS